MELLEYPYFLVFQKKVFFDSSLTTVKKLTLRKKNEYPLISLLSLTTYIKQR